MVLFELIHELKQSVLLSKNYSSCGKKNTSSKQTSTNYYLLVLLKHVDGGSRMVGDLLDHHEC